MRQTVSVLRLIQRHKLPEAQMKLKPIIFAAMLLGWAVQAHSENAEGGAIGSLIEYSKITAVLKVCRLPVNEEQVLEWAPKIANSKYPGFISRVSGRRSSYEKILRSLSGLSYNSAILTSTCPKQKPLATLITRWEELYFILDKQTRLP